MAVSTVTSTSATTTTTIPQPVYRKEEYSVAGIVLKFFDEKAKDIAKALGYTGFWAGQIAPGLPPEVKSFSATMGDFKNFIAITEIPKKTVEAFAAFSALWANMSSPNGSATKAWAALGEAFTKVASWTNSFVDGIDFSSRFIAIDTSVMTWLKGTSFAATFGSSVKGAWEQIQKIGNTVAAQTIKTAFYAISFLRDTSYALLGAKGLFCILTATPMVPWMMVGLLTSGLTFTIGGYFYEKLYDPEGKGKNLNPDVVIANNLARRAYQQQTGLTV